MKVEIWSDIMCPFCYIGKRNFEAALSQLPSQQHIDVEWKSFQLDPTIPTHFDHKTNVYQYLAERKGMSLEQSVQMHQRVIEMAGAAGLQYNFDKAVIANSFQAHRLIQLAKTKGLGAEAEETIFHAYFTDGLDLGDAEVLTTLGEQIGMGRSDIAEALSNEKFADLVEADVEEARRLGINGVPFFVFDRKYGVSGAQPPEAFLQVIEKITEEG